MTTPSPNLIREFRGDLREFKEMTEKFYRKEISIPDYKHFSGGFGSYAQRGGTKSMLRLRLTGGEITKKTLGFIADSIEKYNIDLAHLSTCQSLQLHNLNEAQVCALIEEAADFGIITRGGGGDYPRNVMASPLSGVKPGEPFDVLPFAKKAADYLLGFIKTVKLPRKLKVCFSNTEDDEVHAAFRDLGFVAKDNRTFDVYCAGGLGRSPLMGLKVAENADPQKTLYYVRAMVDLFVTHGNYQNRARSRTRFLQEDMGKEALLSAYQKMLDAALAEGGLDLDIPVDLPPQAEGGAASAIAGDLPPQAEGGAASAIAGAGCGSRLHPRVIPQAQPSRYAVLYKPAGGNVPVARFRSLFNAMSEMEQAAIRIAPTQCLYVINCTEAEAAKIIELTPDSAESHFECSMACIGAGICQVGARNSQATLETCIKAVKPFRFPDKTLPVIRISGCPSSCSAHQIAPLGFRGGVCQTPDGPKPAYAVSAGGSDRLGDARFGEELGVMPEENIPPFLTELGTAVAGAGSTYEQWTAENREAFLAIVGKYLAP